SRRVFTNASRTPGRLSGWGLTCRRLEVCLVHSCYGGRQFERSERSERPHSKRSMLLVAVRILLFSMPDSFEHTPPVAIRIPNGARASLAGNLDRHHQVAVADLLLVQGQVRQTVERLVREHQPDLVGLSVMTFQRGTARRVMSLVRALKPDTRIVVGG